MSEHRLFDGPFPFTTEWYTGREHAPHAEQGIHQPRMQKVAWRATELVKEERIKSIVDLGAGDGGMLAMIRDKGVTVPMWGYDLMETNIGPAMDRGINVRRRDFIADGWDGADLTIITEVLEHLEDPHDLVRRIAGWTSWVIASSPFNETPESHDGCHAWAWDKEGFATLFTDAGFVVMNHEWVTIDHYGCQIVVAKAPA